MSLFDAGMLALVAFGIGAFCMYVFMSWWMNSYWNR